LGAAPNNGLKPVWEDDFNAKELDTKKWSTSGTARFVDGKLQIEVTPIRAEGIRLTFGYRVLGQDGTLKVEGETQHVCASLHEKPRRLPQELKLALGS
jgi:hypothetical protein